MITIAALILLGLRWAPRRRTPAPCTAIDGPCDGRSWLQPTETLSIWLHGEDGQWHLYEPARSRRGTDAAYRYARRTASYLTLTRRAERDAEHDPVS